MMTYIFVLIENRQEISHLCSYENKLYNRANNYRHVYGLFTFSFSLNSCLSWGTYLMFGQLPLVEIDGMCLIESHAIKNYLGWKYNMLVTNKERGR